MSVGKADICGKIGVWALSVAFLAGSYSSAMGLRTILVKNGERADKAVAKEKSKKQVVSLEQHEKF